MTVGSAAFLTGPAPAALHPFSPRRAPAVPVARDWPSGRILVVEPQAIVAFDLQRILRNAGYRVIGPVATAAEARRLIDRGPIQGAIVDLDLDPSAASAVADLLDDAGIPLVFLSGAALEALLDRHRDRPIVEKPYTDACLLEALRQALQPAKNEVAGEFLYPISPPPLPWPRVFPQL
jgi:CheY-like chemotaxis protein